MGCGKKYSSDPRGFVCPNCGEILELAPPGLARAIPGKGERLGVWRYAGTLPSGRKGRVTLEEGGTSLVRSGRIADAMGFRHLYFKVEGQNPTGSFKDRGMTVAVTRAKESGATTLVCASTGNTAASLAAYAARAGLDSAVVLPSGKVATGKLTQAIAHGAKLIQVAGGFDRALAITMRAVSDSNELYLLNSINPYRIEGQKTCAFEIFEQLGRVPDYVVLPVGNAGNISALWKGFKELRDSGVTEVVPKMVGVQAEGASPIAEAWLRGRRETRVWKQPETVASAIRIGNPVSWKKAMRAIEESGGRAVAVSDNEILQARRDLATKEGTYVENASASPLACLRKIRDSFGRDSVVACILTGHGLKESLPEQWEPKNPPVVRDARGLVRALSS